VQTEGHGLHGTCLLSIHKESSAQKHKKIYGQCLLLFVVLFGNIYVAHKNFNTLLVETSGMKYICAYRNKNIFLKNCLKFRKKENYFICMCLFF